MVKLASAEMAEKKLATRAAFGATLAELAEEGVPVVAVDADLTGSTTTKKFAAAAPENADKLFNCGIAEQNMIDVAAGLALTGHVAYTGSFAVFGTGRAYDQIRNTVCYSNLDVKICPTHAGVSVGPDGGCASDARRRLAHARAAQHARARSRRLCRCARCHQARREDAGPGVCPHGPRCRAVRLR